MINYVITGFLMIGLLFSVINGRTNELSESVLESSGKAVNMVISLSGAMALWGGVMQVAQKAGITDKIAKALKYPVKFLFPQLPLQSSVFSTICMNITANLLGLGNAATPLGIKAMKELRELPGKSRNMAMLVVLNTSSIQLIPITVATMRRSHGSATPWDCAVPILMVSMLTVIAGCLMVSALYIKRGKGK